METRESLSADIAYLDACLTDIHERAGDAALTPEQTADFEAGVALRDEKRAALKVIEERHAEIRRIAADRPERVESGATFDAPNVNLNRDANPWDMSELRFDATPTEVRGKALSAMEKADGMSDGDREAAENILRSVDRDGSAAKHIIATSSPAYRSAFTKIAAGDVALLTDDERKAVQVTRAASLTAGSGGYSVPAPIDPTIIDTGSHTVNPFRQIGRVVQTTTNTWKGVGSAGVTASWDAEAAEVSDDTPTLTQPTVTCYKGQAFVPFSVEIEGDWAAIEADLRKMILQGKDDLEGAAFATGSGSSQPYGIVTALAGGSYEINETTDETFTAPDVYALESALDARYRQNASWVANKVWYNKIRQFDTAGGSALWERIGAGQPAELLGRPAYESSNMDSVLPDASATANNYGLVYGDFSNYVIADRVGMAIELVPHLLHTSNNRPSGQRGFLAWWRVGADSVNDAAFRLLNVTTAA